MHEAMDFGGPVKAPLDEGRSVLGVLVGIVVDADVVGGGGDDEINGLVGHLTHSFEAVLVVKVDHGGILARNLGEGKAEPGWSDICDGVVTDFALGGERWIFYRPPCGKLN